MLFAAGSRCTGCRPSAAIPPTTGWSRCSAWKTEIGQSQAAASGRVDRIRPDVRRRARDTWIGILPVGYADGFRRDLTGTEVLVEGERRQVIGAVSMDATAVELDRQLPPGTPVTIVGPGLPLEEHARVAETITYELACRINASPTRARRVVHEQG